MVLFKIIFVYLGISFARYQGVSIFGGLAIGIIAGHVLDMILQEKLRKLRTEKYIKKQNQTYYTNVFLNSVFHLLGKISAVDGVINKEELQYVEKLCTENLKFKKAAKKEALKIFHSAFRSSSSFQYDAAQFYEIHRTQPQALENMLIFLFNLAAADGEIVQAEERLLDTAAQLFNIPYENYLQVKFHYMPHLEQQERKQENQRQHKPNATEQVTPIDEHYKILGCKKSDPAEIIKQKYRKLVADYHPDKIVAKKLPEDFIKFANEKFKSIQQAYEAVKAEKGFN